MENSLCGCEGARGWATGFDEPRREFRGQVSSCTRPSVEFVDTTNDTDHGMATGKPRRAPLGTSTSLHSGEFDRRIFDPTCCSASRITVLQSTELGHGRGHLQSSKNFVIARQNRALF